VPWLHQAEPILWRRDRFEAKGTDVLAGMTKHFPREHHVSPSEKEDMLEVIQAEKAQCRKLIDAIIERMWIELGNCCGLRVQGSNGMQRPLASRNDLLQTLKAVTPPAKLHMLLHFLFNYVRDALYPASLMVTHQWAVEQATLVRLQVRFMAGPPGIHPPKTCLAKLYGEIYNDRKQRLVKAILEPGYSVVVEHKDIPKPKSWKRNKHTFFVYRKRYAGHPSETTEVTTHPLMLTVASRARYPLTSCLLPTYTVRPTPMACLLHLEKECGSSLAEVDRRHARNRTSPSPNRRTPNLDCRGVPRHTRGSAGFIDVGRRRNGHGLGHGRRPARVRLR
jgi:hypothetical protein